jgi:hypothetical protein
MSCWAIVMKVSGKLDASVMFQDTRPTVAEILSSCPQVNVKEGDWVQAMGPFITPGAQEVRDWGYSEGWDSLEGAVLGHLGIQDLECQGIEGVVKDLVKRCAGFKAWRKKFLQGSMETATHRRKK